MLTAAFWGFVGGAALVVGALIGVFARLPTRVIGMVMAFGAGVLISAVAFELVEEGFQSAGAAPVVLGLAGGALTFAVGDWIIDRRGGEHRKRSGRQQSGGAAGALVLGAMLDGIPESAAIGVSLIGGGEVGVAVVVAVFLSNVPESLAASTGLRSAGRSVRWVLGLWFGVAVVCAVAAAAGYGLMGAASPATTAVVQAFAAGAIITMLVDTMVPEASEGAGGAAGLLTAAGFVAAFVLGHVA